MHQIHPTCKSMVIVLAICASILAQGRKGVIITNPSPDLMKFRPCSRSFVEGINRLWQVPDSMAKEVGLALDTLQRVKPVCGPIPEDFAIEDSSVQYLGMIARKDSIVYVNAGNLNLSPYMNSKRFRPDRDLINACDGGPLFWGAIWSVKERRFIEWRFNGSAESTEYNCRQ